MQERKSELNREITDLQVAVVTDDLMAVKALTNSLSQTEAQLTKDLN